MVENAGEHFVPLLSLTGVFLTFEILPFYLAFFRLFLLPLEPSCLQVFLLSPFFFLHVQLQSLLACFCAWGGLWERGPGRGLGRSLEGRMERDGYDVTVPSTFWWWFCCYP